MDKVDKLIAVVRQLREEMGGMTTGSSGPVAGFSAAAPAPTAGTDLPLGKLDGRSRTMRRLPDPYRKALINDNKKKTKKNKKQ
jgi:hypothetical protein